MSEFPVNMVCTTICTKCNFHYSSTVTVFALKEQSFNSECSKCQHRNNTVVTRNMIEDGLDGGKVQQEDKEKNIVVKYIKGKGERGFYFCICGLIAYIFGWILSEMGDGSVDRIGEFILRLAIPFFALGASLMLYAIYLDRKTE